MTAPTAHPSNGGLRWCCVNSTSELSSCISSRIPKLAPSYRVVKIGIRRAKVVDFAPNTRRIATPAPAQGLVCNRSLRREFPPARPGSTVGRATATSSAFREYWRFCQGKDHDFFSRGRADVVVQADHFDAGDFLDHLLHHRPRRFDQVRPYLLEQIPALSRRPGS